MSAIRLSASRPLAMPKTCSGCPMIWPIVCRGFSEPYGFWKMYAIRRRASLLRWRAPGGSSRPPSAMVPVQLRCSPATARATVVLPEPDSPTSARHLDRVADPALRLGEDELGPDAADRVARPDRQQRRHRRLALVDAQGAARREAAAGGAAAGGHRVPGDADQRPAAGQAGDRAHQAPGVGMAGRGEELLRAADL